MIGTKMSLEWNSDMSLRLIRQFRRHEILWNINHDLYFRSNEKEEAWSQICETLGVTKEEAKRKLESLRGSYRREKCRIRTRVMRGQSPKSRWFAFESMKFLDLNHGVKEKTKGRMIQIKEEFVDEDPLSLNSSADHSGFLSLLIKQDVIAEESEPQPVDPNEEGMMKYEDVCSLVKSCISKDDCAVYGDYVATVLRKLDDHARTLVQHKINAILFDALSQNQALLMAQEKSAGRCLNRL